MGIFTISDERHHRLQRFRRNTWMAVALCAALRFAEACIGTAVSVLAVRVWRGPGAG